MFGGAAGGGKSDAGLMGALQYVDVPNFSAAIFRRTRPNLTKPGAILDRAHNWLRGTAAKWDDRIHGFRFPSGATIHFGYGTNLRFLTDSYQGSEFQYIFIDEITQWTEVMYSYLFSRLRPLRAVRAPLRMRSSANPGGVGHSWVKQRFVQFAQHPRGSMAMKDIAERRKGEPLPEPRVYRSPPTAQVLALARELGTTAEGAAFIPSFAADNPGLDLNEYRQELARMDPLQRAQLEHGDWDALAAGNFFQLSWFHFAKAAPAKVRMLRSWDLAGTKEKPNKDPDWSAGVKEGLELLSNQERRLWVEHVSHFREDPGETERNVQAIAKMDGRRVPVLVEQEPGSAGKSVVLGFKTRVLVGHNVIGFPRTGPKEEYWRPVSSLASGGGIWLVEGAWNAAFMDELVGLPVGHDDQADACAAGFDVLAGTTLSAMRLRAMASF